MSRSSPHRLEITAENLKEFLTSGFTIVDLPHNNFSYVNHLGHKVELTFPLRHRAWHKSAYVKGILFAPPNIVARNQALVSETD